jgi:hypothetical protein
MTIKNKLLEEINKKAQKIREKRVEAANNKTIEAAVFDFFRNAEEARLLHDNKRYDMEILSKAKTALVERLRAFDYKIKISVEWNAQYDVDTESPDQDTIRGVTIWWSQPYITKNNCHPSLYIDISQMLFL